MSDDVWITIPEAAVLAKRTTRTIYGWINDPTKPLATRLNDEGKTTVNGRQLLALEPTVRRGRRPGTARPRIR